MSVLQENLITTHPVYTEDNIAKVHLCCPRCTWTGKGPDAEQEFLFLTDATELYCPECNAYLGFYSHDD